ncbi:hypothetical protein GCM10010300_46170 [Streptomyces olivaceoviridis]|uniref:hypothetical protein n=1 Tax=Streptomyces olivaceoviridis TaxID=1921 RepID=UPI00198BBD58|nr:hypothetical protein [Streptomyces olivaceoviridis]GGY96968.1 hypothetical protein GCM10010300_46170 [Streptomyces olivaceoviridis]
MLAQVVGVAAGRAERIEPDRDGDASCYLHEAAALITGNAGQRLNWSARSLDPPATGLQRSTESGPAPNESAWNCVHRRRCRSATR